MNEREAEIRTDVEDQHIDWGCRRGAAMELLKIIDEQRKEFMTQKVANKAFSHQVIELEASLTTAREELENYKRGVIELLHTDKCEKHFSELKKMSFVEFVEVTKGCSLCVKAELEEARRETKSIEDKNYDSIQAWLREKEKREAAEATIQKMREALQKYGDHLKCEKLAGVAGCDCGFDEALTPGPVEEKKEAAYVFCVEHNPKPEFIAPTCLFCRQKQDQRLQDAERVISAARSISTIPGVGGSYWDELRSALTLYDKKGESGG